jgi:3-dehydroquinate dehydratase-2
VSAIGIPVVEVHLTDVRRREPFRRRSTLTGVVAHRCLGRGFDSYREALRWLVSARVGPIRKESRPARARRRKGPA